MVHFQCDGVLSRQPCLWRIRGRIVRLRLFLRLINSTSAKVTIRPLFERITIDLNSRSSPTPSSTGTGKLKVTAIGARTKPYIKSLTVDGVKVDRPIIRHEQIAHGADVVFEMSDEIQLWGNDPAILEAFVGSGHGITWEERVPGGPEPTSMGEGGILNHNEL